MLVKFKGPGREAEAAPPHRRGLLLPTDGDGQRRGVGASPLPPLKELLDEKKAFRSIALLPSNDDEGAAPPPRPRGLHLRHSLRLAG